MEKTALFAKELNDLSFSTIFDLAISLDQPKTLLTRLDKSGRG